MSSPEIPPSRGLRPSQRAQQRRNTIGGSQNVRGRKPFPPPRTRNNEVRRLPTPEREAMEAKIFLAPRDETFLSFLRERLKLFGLRPGTIRYLLEERFLPYFSDAFTHKTANPHRNYEYFEFLGDQVGNTSVVKYLSDNFQELRQSRAVDRLGRLRINLVANVVFANYGKELGLLPFISANEYVRTFKTMKLTADVFEAFLGVVWYIFDRYLRSGSGYQPCYRLVAHMMDQYAEISFDYLDIYDAKSILHELTNQEGWEIPRFDTLDKPPNTTDLFQVQVRIETGDKRFRVYGRGEGYEQRDAEKQASREALDRLKSEGYVSRRQDFQLQPRYGYP